jgi:flagellar motor switch protein FliG
MSVYSRFKKDPSGLRNLVELLECTPKDRRTKMINVGMEEDSEYTQRAVGLMMNFEDVLALKDSEMAEVMVVAPVRSIGAAFSRQPADFKKFILTCCPMSRMGEVRDLLEMEYTLPEIGGAQLKLIETTRKLERQGTLRVKKIPA